MKSLSVKMIALVLTGALFQSANAQTESKPAAEKAKEAVAPAAPAVATTAEVAPAAAKEAAPAATPVVPVPAAIAPAAADASKKEKAKEKVAPAPPANKE